MVFSLLNKFFGKGKKEVEKHSKKILRVSKNKKYFTDDQSFKMLISNVFNLDEADNNQITVLSDSFVNFFEDPKAKIKVSFKGLGDVAYYFRGGEDDLVRILSFKLSSSELEKGKTASDVLNAIYNPENNKQMHSKILSKGHVSDLGVHEEFQVEKPIQDEPVYKSLFAFEDLFFEICTSSATLRNKVKKEVFVFKKDFESKNPVKKKETVANKKDKKDKKDKKTKK